MGAILPKGKTPATVQYGKDAVFVPEKVFSWKMAGSAGTVQVTLKAFKQTGPWAAYGFPQTSPPLWGAYVRGEERGSQPCNREDRTACSQIHPSLYLTAP